MILPDSPMTSLNRRFRFGVRTLFVVVTATALFVSPVPTAVYRRFIEPHSWRQQRLWRERFYRMPKNTSPPSFEAPDGDLEPGPPIV
jgi:hypothetical protein